VSDYKLEVLRPDELFGRVGRYAMSIKCDTGAQISIVPRECVEPHQFTGKRQIMKAFQGILIEGKVCNVTVTIANREFERVAVAVQGEILHWTSCFHVPYRPRSEMEFILDEMEKKDQLEEKDRHYLPPEMKDGALISGEMVSAGIVLPPHTSTQAEQSELTVSKSNENEGNTNVIDTEVSVRK